MNLPPIRLLVVALTNSLLCNFVAIYSYAVLNVPALVLQKFVEESYFRRFGYFLTGQSQATLWGFLVCSWDIGGTFGALLTSCMDDRFGRKDTLFILNNLINIISCILILFAKGVDSFELLILGRFISGIASGVAATSVGVFATECSPTKFRGFVGSFSFCLQPIICILSMLLGLPQCLGNERNWCYLLSLSGIVSILLIMISSIFPESPKYLYIEMNDKSKAEKSVKFYYGDDADIEEAFTEFENEAQLTNVAQVSWKEILTVKHLRIPLILSCVANFSQDALGSDVLSNYSTDIIEKLSGMSAQGSMITTILTSIPGVFAAIISMVLVEVVGRKGLLLSGITLATIANGALMTLALTQHSSAGTSPAYAYSTAVAVGLQTFGLYLGPASIPQFIFGEITPTSSRALTAGVAMGVNYAASVMYSFIYPPLSNAIRGYSFLIMIIPSMICGVYLYYYLPEPKGKTVDEIVSIWMDNSRKNNVDDEYNEERPLLQNSRD